MSIATAVPVDNKVEKLHDAVPRLDEIIVRSGEAEQIQNPTIDTLPSEAVTSTVVNGPQPRGRHELTLLQNSERQLAFVAKASELSVNGMLALNGATAAALHAWILRKQASGDRSKSMCEHTGWQICITLAPIPMYLLTLWVTCETEAMKLAIKQATEQEPIDLSILSGFVLAFFIWPVLMGCLMTHCMAGAAIWIIFLVAAPVILTMFIIWGTIFGQPTILRRCLSWRNRRGRRDPEVAAAQHADDSSAA